MTLSHEVKIGFKRSINEQGFARTKLETLEGEPLVGASPEKFESLATFIHLSDLHVCDSQSPARLEFLDRYADPDFETRKDVDYVGTYRAQEFLSLQVVEAMVQAANQVTVGPLASRKVDAVFLTGDVIDNGQFNELTWYKRLMDGGAVSSASGAEKQVEAFQAHTEIWNDEHFYQPDADSTQRVLAKFGLPQVDGLPLLAQAEFAATGLRHPWLAIHGNHDALLQGVAAPNEELNALVTGSEKLVDLAEGTDLLQVFAEFTEVGPAVYPPLSSMDTKPVTADERRRLVEMEDWVNVHTSCGHDHGLTQALPTQAHYYRDFGEVRLIALDTVNHFGGWQGCIHREQFDWLKKLLVESADKYVMLTSHHPLQDLFNGYVPEGVEPPALTVEVEQLLLSHPNVILWVAGHVHDHSISSVAREDGNVGFWQIRTTSHIDWPQQGRTVEILRTEDGHIVVGTVVLNHAGPVLNDNNCVADLVADGRIEAPVALAGLSRYLAANDWQRFDGSQRLEVLEGQPEDRNAWLWIKDPFSGN
jgi:metallophosphoesterase (TIGR03767 family)